MRKDLTDITVVLDRSGSMQSCLSDAIGGLNTFVDEQKKLPGEGVFTLVQFDTVYEFVHTAVPLTAVPKCDLVPRGGTALLDAVGRAIIETGERLKAMPDEQRPGLVVFVIVTDGGENSSREFTRAKIKEMVEHQTNAYQWQFTYLGANQDAFTEAGQMGILRSATSNYSMDNTSETFKSAHKNVARMRTASLQGGSVQNGYTEQERQEMTQQ